MTSVAASSTDGGSADGRVAGIRLLDAAPEMASAVPDAERELARRTVLAPVVSLEAGPLGPASATTRSGFAWLIVRGIVLRRTSLGERPVSELLGPGDLVDTRPDDELWSRPARTEHVVHERATLAVLDDRFRLAARKWPRLHDVVAVQHARQTRRASRQLAAGLGMPRVEDRVLALFSDLADRWGRMTPHGIAIELRLTHSLIGELVGSRRPTVSLALTELAGAGVLTRDDDRTWLLAPAATEAA